MEIKTFFECLGAGALFGGASYVLGAVAGGDAIFAGTSNLIQAAVFGVFIFVICVWHELKGGHF